MASYYSNRLHGQRMSDGSRYHRDSMVCAHKRFPLGTYLKVTNLKNRKSVIVRVADRCRGSRIIDLSYAAAKEIGIVASGVAMVSVERHDPRKGVPYRDDAPMELPEIDVEVTRPYNFFQHADTDFPTYDTPSPSQPMQHPKASHPTPQSKASQSASQSKAKGK